MSRSVTLRWLALLGALLGCHRTARGSDQQLAGCEGQPRAAAFSPAWLRGDWQLTLVARERSATAPYAASASGRPAAERVTGRVSLFVGAATGREESALSCEDCISGRLFAALDSVLRRDVPGWVPPGAPVIGGRWPYAADLLALEVGEQRCADCGRLVLLGERRGEVVCGEWHQSFLGRGDQGIFLLRRQRPGET